MRDSGTCYKTARPEERNKTGKAEKKAPNF